LIGDQVDKTPKKKKKGQEKGATKRNGCVGLGGKGKSTKKKKQKKKQKTKTGWVGGFGDKGRLVLFWGNCGHKNNRGVGGGGGPQKKKKGKKKRGGGLDQRKTVCWGVKWGVWESQTKKPKKNKKKKKTHATKKKGGIGDPPKKQKKAHNNHKKTVRGGVKPQRGGGETSVAGNKKKGTKRCLTNKNKNAGEKNKKKTRLGDPKGQKKKLETKGLWWGVVGVVVGGPTVGLGGENWGGKQGFGPKHVWGLAKKKNWGGEPQKKKKKKTQKTRTKTTSGTHGK